jgi:hypothetical protein
MRVIDIDFENVEITFYAKRISENKEVSYQGFVAGAEANTIRIKSVLLIHTMGE